MTRTGPRGQKVKFILQNHSVKIRDRERDRESAENMSKSWLLCNAINGQSISHEGAFRIGSIFPSGRRVTQSVFECTGSGKSQIAKRNYIDIPFPQNKNGYEK